MAGVADNGRSILFMAIDAGGHFGGTVQCNLILRLNLAVAGGAFHFGGAMPRMAKEDKIRQLIDTARRQSLRSFLGVARLASLPCGKARPLRANGAFVTKHALQIQFRMPLVRERLGLRGSGEQANPEKNQNAHHFNQYRLLIHLTT
jgi:hypothetical protein